MTSAGVAAVAIVALFVVYHYEPSADPGVRAMEKGKLSPNLFGVLQTCLTTFLSIGAISLLFEMLLRESYGRDLRRFLRLRTALVRSGLQDVGPETEVDWKEVLESAAQITMLVRDPSQWLLAHLGAAIGAAKKRKAEILIGLPDPDGARLQEIASSIGLAAPELRQNIMLAVNAIENQWNAARTHLQAGSTIRVVAYPELPLHELVIGDQQLVCLVAKPIGHDVGVYPLALTFDQDRHEYPTQWLREALDTLEGRNDLWAGGAP